MNDGEHNLKRLRHNCSLTLERFVEVARSTCKMASMLHKLPVSQDQRLAIYLQKKREDGALSSYRKASHALLGALEIQPDLPDSSPAPQSPPAGRSGGAKPNTQRRGTDDGHAHT